MKLSGTFTPVTGMNLDSDKYENATLILNESYSMLDVSEPLIVVDLCENGEVIRERILCTTLFNYSGDESGIVEAGLLSIKSNCNLDDMEISDE